MEKQGSDVVRDYYASFHQRELSRLLTAEGRLEFTLTTRLLRPHLPFHGRVLDIGGGPGRYAAWLAQQGLTVSLADLSPNLLDLAGEHLTDTGITGVNEIAQADNTPIATPTVRTAGAHQDDPLIRVAPSAG